MDWKITRNAVRCRKCGDVIESRTAHEWVMCSCGAAGVDGGLDYRRRLGLEGDMDELSEFADAPKDFVELCAPVRGLMEDIDFSRNPSTARPVETDIEP